MSKMSQLHAELTEQANDLGFESIEQAQANGCEVDYLHGVLLPSQEMAHKAWLEERTEVLAELGRLHEGLIERGYDALAEMADHAMKFIERGEV